MTVHRRRTLFIVGFAALLGGSASPSAVVAQDTQPALDDVESVAPVRVGVEAAADRLLREMGEYLASVDAFSFRADVTEDSVLATGQKIQLGGRTEVTVQRPGRLHAHFQGDERHTRSIIGGGLCTIHDVAANVYAVTEVPDNLGDAIDRIFQKYGFTVPIADLVYDDPFEVLMQNVDYGFLVGRHTVDGTLCHHLAFTQEVIDWQIWIEDGPRPVPRKLLITYKNEPGSPQYTARLSEWRFEPHLSKGYFEFDPPPGADRIEFLPIEETEVEE
ncbi:MAG: DUF2092 domain-containing protein [Planctomycetota bacterium]|jgi:hypothetical protein